MKTWLGEKTPVDFGSITCKREVEFKKFKAAVFEKLL
jgi:hypothetical protein